MRLRRSVFGVAIAIAVLAGPEAWACGGLIGPRGAVNLGRTTTLAAYLDGVEHYITAFKFSGAGGQFGSLVPLPGIPTKVERGGDWTLQRLSREVAPRVVAQLRTGSTSSADAEVVYHIRIDALDITVLKGGAAAVGKWAKEHGFLLPPDAPAVLDFYARRSPIFAAAIFDGQAAAERGQQIGDGTPIHFTIPTENPWVPLRILSLGKSSDEFVDADIFLLTPRKPALLPVRAEGIVLERREPASEALLADLRSDTGMEWLPAKGMWLTYMRIASPAQKLRFDLATDVSGRGRPSWTAAGLARPTTPTPSPAPVSESPAPSPAPSGVPPAVATTPIEPHEGVPATAFIAGGVLLAVATSALVLLSPLRLLRRLRRIG